MQKCIKYVGKQTGSSNERTRRKPNKLRKQKKKITKQKKKRERKTKNDYNERNNDSNDYNNNNKENREKKRKEKKESKYTRVHGHAPIPLDASHQGKRGKCHWLIHYYLLFLILIIIILNEVDMCCTYVYLTWKKIPSKNKSSCPKKKTTNA